MTRTRGAPDRAPRRDRLAVMRASLRGLSEPATAGLDVDDPQTTELRRAIIREKPFLNALYREWYSLIADEIPPGDGRILELGSGAGFLREIIPHLITSEVFPVSNADIVLDGCALPVPDASLHALVLIDVLHHIGAVRRFLSDASRALKPSGRLLMIEPWVTPWSRLIYGHFHHEPFRPEAEQWEFPSAGPLSSANGALPWILFERDRQVFESEYPSLRIVKRRLMIPFRYALSGGVSMRALVPAWSFRLFRGLETALDPIMSSIAMFALIVVEKRG